MSQSKEMEKVTGEARGLMDFITSTASKRLAVTCLLMATTIYLALGTMQSSGDFAISCLWIAAVSGIAYVLSETAIKCAKVYRCQFDSEEDGK